MARVLPFEPTEAQRRAMVVLSRFLASEKERVALLLTGYAGTGKTSLMGALVQTLISHKKRFCLMAPTGRAAKVLSKYTGRTAFTVHKSIYRRAIDSSGSMRFALKENKWRNCLFIVDEASMIGGPELLGRDLLSDLIEFVYSGDNCRLLMLGDDAQLPPVHEESSPALDVELLRHRFDLRVAETKMKEVVRQEAGSGILKLATALRFRIDGDEQRLMDLDIDRLADVRSISGVEMAEAIETEYDRCGMENVKVICRSNKRANNYNKHIRSRILYLEEELASGDKLMVVRNNYHWLEEDSGQAFIANGDMAEVQYVRTHRELFDLRFATVGLSFIDYTNAPTIECNVLLDVLDTDGPSLPQERSTKFYHDVKEDYMYLESNAKIRAALREDPWLNALQVKYGNAITCHKSQGGQWPVIFIDRGFITEESMDKSYWRWLYTAVTRATEKVYLVGFEP